MLSTTTESVKALDLLYVVKLIQSHEFLMFTFLQNSTVEIYRKLMLVRNPTGLFRPFFCSVKIYLFLWISSSFTQIIYYHCLLIILVMLFLLSQSQTQTLSNVLQPGMRVGVCRVSSVGLLNSAFCWIRCLQLWHTGLCIPVCPFLWFRNPIKNYPWSQNNCGQKSIDNPHPNLSNLSVIILYHGEKHVGTSWQCSRLKRGNVRALLWKALQLL